MQHKQTSKWTHHHFHCTQILTLGSHTHRPNIHKEAPHFKKVENETLTTEGKDSNVGILSLSQSFSQNLLHTISNNTTTSNMRNTSLATQGSPSTGLKIQEITLFLGQISPQRCQSLGFAAIAKDANEATSTTASKMRCAIFTKIEYKKFFLGAMNTFTHHLLIRLASQHASIAVAL